MRSSPPATEKRPGAEAAEIRLAANPTTHADTLRALAADERVTVRVAVALNPSTPDGVDAQLAGDADVRVRQVLGQKLATLIPHLSDRDHGRLHQQALATLYRLVDDEAERVRVAIAAIVKDMPQAPRELILRLARDMSVPVSEPVLRLSPVLTTADLLAMLASPPTPRTAPAIAGRAQLDASVSAVIAEGDDTEAIRILLENGSAHVQEATLDALIARAAREEAWHEPMVHRPVLSGPAAIALSQIVTDRLLAVLAARSDLPRGVTTTLRRKLASRLPKGEPGQDKPPPPKSSAGPAAAEEALEQALALHAAGRLEAGIRKAAQHGDVLLCVAMLSVAAGVELRVVERAASLRSAKAIVSLAWLGNLSIDVAVSLQALVGQIAPTAMLRGRNGKDFPLRPDEMRWQVELLKQSTT